MFYKKGSITIYVIIFGGIFLILCGGLFGFILMQLRQTSYDLSWNKALDIAEAGIDYYRWCLNHEIEDTCDDELEKDYKDTSGNTIGTFSLAINSIENCGIKGATAITSTGWTKEFPQTKREIQILYAKKSVAEYAYLLNDNVWAGADREIRGLYHSNGGVRMDGENQSLTTSAQEEWICTSSFGCNPCPTGSTPACRISGSDCICPGVFTTTGNSQSDLFNSPVPLFDFNGITMNLAQMKTLTKDGGYGLYFGPSGDEGYHIILKDDGDGSGSIDVWKVTNVQMIGNICITVGSKVLCDNNSCQVECPQCLGGRCVVKDPIISAENFMGNYEIPQNCGVIFFEDNLWIGNEGTESKVKGKITVVSADLITTGVETDVWLQGNITYGLSDGSDGLAVLAQHNNLIGLYCPDNMELKGIFIAQTGHFGRNHYPCSDYPSHCKRNELDITGSIVSNGRVGTRWTSGGQIISGFLKRNNYSDQNLIYNPPLFVPYTESEFSSIYWEELE
jgi:hypothetical protein